MSIADDVGADSAKQADHQFTAGCTQGAAGLFYMDENSPLSGEFQKGEAYPHQKADLLCYKKDVLTFSVAKESNNG